MGGLWEGGLVFRPLVLGGRMGCGCQALAGLGGLRVSVECGCLDGVGFVVVVAGRGFCGVRGARARAWTGSWEGWNFGGVWRGGFAVSSGFWGGFRLRGRFGVMARISILAGMGRVNEHSICHVIIL